MAEQQPPGAEDPSPAEQQPPGAQDPSPAEEQPPGAQDPGPAEGTDASADGAATERRTLRRSSTDKVIAGVAGGIGAYFGIDSVIVRIAFILLTFLGGAGPFLYLIGWLALPTEDSPSVVAKALGGNSPNRFRNLLAVALIGFGLLITANLSGDLFDLFIDVWRIAPYLALILIAAGVALVLWPGPAGGSKTTPARPPVPSAPPPGTPPPSSAFASPAPAPPAAAGPEWSTAPPTGPEWSTAPPTGPAPTAGAPSSQTKRRRDRSWIGTLTVAALLVYTGTAVMLERLDVVDLDLGVFFAVALATTGAGLLASAFARPARGLIVLGLALSAPLMLFVAVDVPGGLGIGEARVRVIDVEELEDEYRHGIGQLTVDLRDLDPERTDHSVELSLGIGELRVYVPESIATTADIDVRAGNIRTWSGYTWYSWEASEDGLDVSRTITVPVQGETTGDLRLDIDVGIGEARLITVPAPVEGSNR